MLKNLLFILLGLVIGIVIGIFITMWFFKKKFEDVMKKNFFSDNNEINKKKTNEAFLESLGFLGNNEKMKDIFKSFPDLGLNFNSKKDKKK